MIKKYTHDLFPEYIKCHYCYVSIVMYANRKTVPCNQTRLVETTLSKFGSSSWLTVSLYLSPAAETVDTYSSWDAGGPVNVNEVLSLIHI